MAVTLIAENRIGFKITARTDSSADWGSVGNDTYFYDVADDLAYYTDAASNIIPVFTKIDNNFLYSSGVLSLNTLPLYISDITTVNLLDDTGNWDINGNYTGTAITGTFQGQKHYNSTYFFECVHDNVWIRIARS